MNSKTRPVAVVGGNRIPFARSNGTGLETTILVANKIALGQIDSGVNGNTVRVCGQSLLGA